MSNPSAPRILDGKKIAAELRADVARQVADLTAAGRRPRLAVFLVGDDPASHSYVASKARACEEVGIFNETLNLPATVGRKTLLDMIRHFNEEKTVDGILVQLPLPDHLAEREIVATVLPEKDVDGFNPENVGRLWLGTPGLPPATPAGILELLRRSEIDLEGRHAVIVGRSAIVGKPLAALLLREHCTVTICHSRTRDLPAVCRRAELLVAAVGQAGLIGPDHVSEGAVVIDVGTNRITDPTQVEHLFPGDDKRRERFAKRGYLVVGDVDFHRVAPKASAITPVPGGVGPLTVAQLMVNTLEASRRRQAIQDSESPSAVTN